MADCIYLNERQGSLDANLVASGTFLAGLGDAALAASYNPTLDFHPEDAATPYIDAKDSIYCSAARLKVAPVPGAQGLPPPARPETPARRYVCASVAIPCARVTLNE